MKRLVLAFLLCASPVSAQVSTPDNLIPRGLLPFDGSPGSFPGCPTCGVTGYVDLPADQQTVSALNFVVHGWGFELFSGMPVDRVDVMYQDYDGYWRSLRQPMGALTANVARPDVQWYMTPFFPNVSATTGWQLVVSGMPLGLRRVLFNIWHGAYYTPVIRTYLVTQ